MSTTRRVLGSLGCEMNVGGPEYLRRRVGPERTPVQRHTTRMYEMQQEAWRGLSRPRVAAFIRLLILCFVELQNGLPLQSVTYRLLKKKLVNKIIPWIYNRLSFTMDERYWPITLAQFRELDSFLADHLPCIQKEDEWDAIRYFYEEVLKQREEYKRMEQMEKEARESVRRVLQL